MAAARGEFSSRFGFLMAASGSAVGLGNVWGFPTNAASNGGAAFLFTYLILVFALAYPALMAELIIGRHARANAVTALKSVATNSLTRKLAITVGLVGIVTVCLILSFYAIVGGWMIAHFFEPLARMIGMSSLAEWLRVDAELRNGLFEIAFMGLTIYVVSAGVKDGIEKWSTRLMPSLVAILVLLTLYVFTLPGAMEGLRVYLVPDIAKVANPLLLVDAMGQAFFSLSLGVGTMLIYGSYINKRENLPVVGSMVALLDSGISVLAGLLILPAMYVALQAGVEIFDANGGLIAGPGLIVSVLPALFDNMGAIGILVGVSFFALMSIAALTSSISMLEVPVAYAAEHHAIDRRKAALMIGIVITLFSLVIVFNFDPLFDLVSTYTTEYSQPLLGLFFCVFVAWIWNRNAALAEIKQGCPDVESSWFWKIWPFYVKYVCPLAILAMYLP